MRIRSIGLGVVATLSLIAAACNAGATGTPVPTATPGAGSSAPASNSPAPSSALKIGVVTDIGTLDDKNFNEYSFKGAQAGAAAIGAPDPKAIVTKNPADYATNIKSFVDQKFDIIVTVGFNLAAATSKAAVANKDTWFIGVDQGPICMKANGDQDFTFPCPVDPTTLAPKYISVDFKEDQAGYLAGIVAAAVSKTGHIGAIGGTSLCAPCIRYIQGYELGAKSLNSAIKVTSAYVTNDFSQKAFHDSAAGKAYAQNFLTTNKDVDVVFQVAGDTGNGVLDATCSAGLMGIGVDVDQWLSLTGKPGQKCIVTSAEKHLSSGVSQAIQSIAAGSAKGGDTLFNAVNDGVGISPFHDKDSLISADVKQKLADALAAMKASPALKTCPDTCGVLPK